MIKLDHIFQLSRYWKTTGNETNILWKGNKRISIT